MEAIAALGLAASILQFINFGVDILSKGNEIHTSVGGTLVENATIEVVVTHLKDTLARLQTYPTVRSPAAQNLQTECARLINDILRALDKVKSNGPPSKWKSLRKALKSVRSKKQIEQWLRQLESLRNEYNTELEVEILTTIDLQGVEQTQSFQDLDASQKALTQTLLNAIRDDHDNLEAIAEKHAIDIKSLIQQELDHSRALISQEATATRDTIAAEHAATRSHVAVESGTTRQFIEQRSVAEVTTITECIVKTADSQVQAQQHSLGAVEQSVRSAVFSEVRNVTQTLSVEMDLQNFTTGLQILDGDRAVIDSLSHQLADTTHALWRMEARQTTNIRNFTRLGGFRAQETMPTPRDLTSVFQKNQEQTGSGTKQSTVSRDPADILFLLRTTGIEWSDDPPRPSPSTLEADLDSISRSLEQPLDHLAPTPAQVPTTTIIDQTSNFITIPGAVLNSVASEDRGLRMALVLRTPAARRKFFAIGRIFEKCCFEYEDFSKINIAPPSLRHPKNAQFDPIESVTSVVVRRGKYSCLCVPLFTLDRRYSLTKNANTYDGMDACAATYLFGKSPIRDGPVQGRPSLAVHLEGGHKPTLPELAYMDFRSSYEHPYIPNVVSTGFVDQGSLESLEAYATKYTGVLRDLSDPQTDKFHLRLLNMVKEYSSRVHDQNPTKYSIDRGTSYYVYVCSLNGSTNTAWSSVREKLEDRYESFQGSDQASMFVLLLDPDLSECQTPEFASLFEASTVKASVVMSVTWSGMLRDYELMPDVCDFFRNGSIKPLAPSVDEWVWRASSVW